MSQVSLFDKSTDMFGDKPQRELLQKAVITVSAVMRVGIRAVNTGCSADSSLDYINLDELLMCGCVALDATAL